MTELFAKVEHLLPKQECNLKLDIITDVVEEPLISLLHHCANFFYKCNNCDTVDKVKEFHPEKDCSKCISYAQVILDITWEKLNTGYWKDVDISWRYVYSYASLFKALSMLMDKSITSQDVVKVCDMGLVMGAPVLNNILSHIATILTVEKRKLFEDSEQKKKIQKTLVSKPSLSETCCIPCDNCPSLETFSDKYMKKKQPVIIKNAISFWPALSTRKWSISYLLDIAGNRTVPIEIGSKYTDENWSQKLVTLEDFIYTYIYDLEGNEKIGYLAQHQLFDQIPQLREDINIPSYCCLSECDDDEVDVNAWFGPAGTISPLHHDPKHNLLAQVMGEKYIRLYPEEATSSLYPHEVGLLDNTSQVDIENPDLEKFPLFSTADYQEGILEAGDLLYIPPRHWHYVRSLAVSFSVSFWWQ